MTEHNHTHNHGPADSEASAAAVETGQPIGPGYTYLSNALKVSFILLQIIMIVLIVLFLASGFQRVNYDEQALVLTFGKISGVAEARLREPGLRWVWPYPVGEIIRIPVQRKINVSLNQFWYYQKPGEEMGESPTETTYVPPTLNPLTEGYCLVRGEKQTFHAGDFEGGSTGSAELTAGSDYNILHSKWVLTYQITDPVSFYKNCHVETGKLQAGQNYADIVEESIRPMLEDLLSNAVVETMVNYTIEEAMYEKSSSVTDHVKRLVQEKLNKVKSGIMVIDVQRNRIAVPRQVEAAFQAAHTAVAAREKTISAAKLYAEKTMSETAGLVAGELLKALKDKNTSEQQKERLWSQLAGRAQEEIAGARAYRTQTVETARANAEYLRRILPEYRKHPNLVIQRIYTDAMEQILETADEKIIIQPGKTARGKEVRISINRDPAIKPKSETQK